MKTYKLSIFLIVLSAMISPTLSGQATMDEKEIIAHMQYVTENASPDYLNPGPELYGKYRVCKDYQVIAVFDSEAEALEYAKNHPPGSIEIRRAYQTEDGLSVSVMIPGAISKIED